MSNQRLIQFFKDSNLVSPKSAEEIANAFSPEGIKKNDLLLKEGRVCD